jgi:prophage regulatory protein
MSLTQTPSAPGVSQRRAAVNDAGRNQAVPGIGHNHPPEPLYPPIGGEDRFIREPECREITGLSRPTRWRLEKAGLFPKKRQLSPGCKGWLGSEIHAWMAGRAAS